MKKLIFTGFLCFLILFFLPSPAYAEDSSFYGDILSITGQLDLTEIDEYVKTFDEELTSSSNSLLDLWRQAKSGEISLSFKGVMQVLSNLFFNEVKTSGVLLAQLIVLAVISLLLNNLKSSFEKSNVALLSKSIVYLVLISIALYSFRIGVSTAQDAVENMSGFLYALMPVLLTLLTALGGVTSVSIFHPAMLGAVSIAINIIKTVILSLAYFYAALSVVGYITPRFQVDKLAKLCRDIAIGLLSIVMTVFMAFLGLAGLSGAAIDGLAIKAAKTATGIFVPIVGKYLSDITDTVLSTALVLKNSIGIAGIIILFVICAMPAIKLLAMVLMYRLTAALIQPMGDKNLADALQGLGSALMLLFAVVTMVGVLFFFVVSITIGMGNVAMMLR